MKDKITIAISLVIIIAVAGYFLTKSRGEEQDVIFIPQVSEVGGITFTVTPVDFNADSEVKFEVSIDTHSGSLDFDPAKISLLEDDLGNQYQPSSWDGSAPGGHHRSGVLIFPAIGKSTAKIKLIINDGSQRVFEWELK